MLIDKLKEKQAVEKLSDEAFARMLGISRQHWQFIKGGQRKIADKVIRGTLKQFPDLTKEVLVFLQTNGKMN
ncbi:MAG: hypothetical protein PVI20_09810 [Desulfobacteraceae bacterium]|jgi:plasmid maintenance system antidote protein VapI